MYLSYNVACKSEQKSSLGFCLLLNIDTIQPFGKTFIGLDQHKVYNLNKGWGIATLYLHPYICQMRWTTAISIEWSSA